MREAAKRAGISPTTWSDLEAGNHPPEPRTQRGVAAAFGWRIDWYDYLQEADAAVAEELAADPTRSHAATSPSSAATHQRQLVDLTAQVDGLTQVVDQLLLITGERLPEHVDLVEIVARLAAIEERLDRQQPP